MPQVIIYRVVHTTLCERKLGLLMFLFTNVERVCLFAITAFFFNVLHFHWFRPILHFTNR